MQCCWNGCNYSYDQEKCDVCDCRQCDFVDSSRERVVWKLFFFSAASLMFAAAAAAADIDDDVVVVAVS